MKPPKKPQIDPKDLELIDAGKRIADEYAMHRLADPIGNLGHFMAVKLADGTSDHALYPDMDTARRVIGQRDNEDNWYYIQIVPTTLHADDAAILLNTHRKLYAAGIRVSAMNGRTMIPRITREDQRNQVLSVFGKARPTNIRYGE